MPKLEYFLQRTNTWLTINIQDYINILFTQEDSKFYKIKSLQGLPIDFLVKDSIQNETKSILNENMISGNYVEVLNEQELKVKEDKKKGSLILENKNNFNRNDKKKYEVWSRAKIIMADLENQIIFLENNDQLTIIDDINNKIRPLKEEKLIKDDISLYFIREISSSQYDLFKTQLEKIINSNNNNNNNNQLIIHQYDPMNSSLIVIGVSSLIKQLTSLKEWEEKYNNKESIEDNNTNSNKDSSQNIIGVTNNNNKNGKSSEESSSSEKNVIDYENYKYKESYCYRNVFKRDIEKILGNCFKKNKSTVTKLNNDEFKICVFGENEKEFLEEKNNFEKNYKKDEIKIDVNADKNEIKNLATKANIKMVHYDKKVIYLVGKDKNINIFKTLLDVNLKYSKEIQKNDKEREDIKKKLVSFKKEYKIK